MKKLVLVLVLVAMILVPVTSAAMETSSAAKSTYAVGLNLGTNSGIGFQYKLNKDFDLIGNLGLDNFATTRLSFDAAVNVKVYQFSIEDADFDVTVGAGAYVGIPLQSGLGFDVSAIVPVGIVYSFDEDIAPIDLYIRLAPGLQIIKANVIDLGFDFMGYIGGLWRFN
jgi:hypothetical protein